MGGDLALIGIGGLVAYSFQTMGAPVAVSIFAAEGLAVAPLAPYAVFVQIIYGRGRAVEAMERVEGEFMERRRESGDGRELVVAETQAKIRALENLALLPLPLADTYKKLYLERERRNLEGIKPSD